MVQKGPNGPETLLTCIIHNYRSYWPALGPFRYPRGAKRAISAQSLKLFGPNFGSQKNLRNIGMWGVQRVATECPVHILLLRTILSHPMPLRPFRGSFWPQGALLRAPKVLGRPQEAKFGLKCQRLVHLGGPHQYQVLWPLKRPLRPSRGPQKGPFWPQEALWGPPNFLPRI